MIEYLERSYLTEENIEEFFMSVCKNYNIGKYLEYEIVEVGYEDLNIILTTSNGKFLLKVLNKDRTEENAKWYTDVQLKIYQELKDKTVGIFKNSSEEYLSRYNTDEGTIYYNLLEYFPSKNLYETNKNISVEDVIRLAFDVLLFGYKTPELMEYLKSVGESAKQYDPWSFENIIREYNEKKECLSEEQKNLVLPFVNFWDDVTNYPKYYSECTRLEKKQMLEDLRKTPTQRDFISTNVLSDGNNFKLIDHSITGITFDFIDLAVFGCDVAMIKNITDEDYIDILKILGYIYKKTTEEFGYNYNAYGYYMILVGIQHSLHIINAQYLKSEEELNDPQNQYWIDLGERGTKAIINAGYHNCSYPRIPYHHGPQGYIENTRYKHEKEIEELLKRKGLFDLVMQKIADFKRSLNEEEISNRFPKKD